MTGQACGRAIRPTLAVRCAALDPARLDDHSRPDAAAMRRQLLLLQAMASGVTVDGPGGGAKDLGQQHDSHHLRPRPQRWPAAAGHLPDIA
jgi:hypothetical protein